MAKAARPLTLSEQLTSARDRLRLTQTQVAERAGMTPAAYSRVECGRSSPSYELLFLLSKALRTPLTVDWQAIPQLANTTKAAIERDIRFGYDDTAIACTRDVPIELVQMMIRDLRKRERQ